MSIPVICPGCKAAFRVSDKFAGQTGPCPKCKAPIKIPKAEAEVKIHAPDEAEPKDSKGRVLSKPIPRFEPRVSTKTIVVIVAGILATFLVAGLVGRGMGIKYPLALAGTPLVAFPLVLWGYYFLREEEAEPYRGRILWLRGAICAAVYSLLWGAFYFMPNDWIVEYWSWFYIALPFLAAGALTAFACFDLEFGNAFFHYCFFLVATLLLRSLIGLPALWNMTAS